jgi:hypothetical protein
MLARSLAFTHIRLIQSGSVSFDQQLATGMTGVVDRDRDRGGDRGGSGKSGSGKSGSGKSGGGGNNDNKIGAIVYTPTPCCMFPGDW